MPNWLLITMNTTGSFQSAARFIDLAERALVGGAVAEHADDRRRRCRGSRTAARRPAASGRLPPDDPVAAEEAPLEVEQVHRAAAALGAAVHAAEQLGHHGLGMRAARDRLAVLAVGGDQVVAVAHRLRASRRPSPPRRCTGAGSRRSSPSRTSRPRAPRSGGSASSSRAPRGTCPCPGASAGCAHRRRCRYRRSSPDTAASRAIAA